MDFIGAIPSTASAIKVSGGEGEAVRISLEANLTGEQLTELMNLRGCVIKVHLERE